MLLETGDVAQGFVVGAQGLTAVQMLATAQTLRTWQDLRVGMGGGEVGGLTTCFHQAFHLHVAVDVR